MKPVAAGAVIVAPSLGPAIVQVFGVDVPVLALGVSCLALVLARWIAPPSLRKLTRWQQVALTLLLLIFLFLAVTGEMPFVGDGEPMTVGWAVVWAVGLGFSGILIVETMSELFVETLVERMKTTMRVMFGIRKDGA